MEDTEERLHFSEPFLRKLIKQKTVFKCQVLYVTARTRE